MAGPKIISLALCLFGVFKSLQPHRLAFHQAVIVNYPNITEEEVNGFISPVKDYSCIVFLVGIILVTDYVKYKPIIILQGFFAVIFISLFNWNHQYVPLIVAMVFKGFAFATNTAFYAYIFAIACTEQYKLNISLSQVSVLFGMFLGNLLGVLLTSLNITGFETLNYISLAFSFLSLIVSLLLPHVKPRIPTTREIIERELQTPNGISEVIQKSPWEVDRRTSLRSTDTQGIVDTYTHINDPAFTAYARGNIYSDIDTSSLGFYSEYSSEPYISSIGSESVGDNASITSRGDNSAPPVPEVNVPQPSAVRKQKFAKIVKDLKKAYGEKLVVLWSSWLVVSVCVFLILDENFIRLLDEIVPDRINPTVYDRSVCTLATLLGLIPVLLFGVVNRTLTVYTEPLIALFSMWSCICVTVLANTHNVWLVYSLYLLFYMAFQLGFVLALFEIGNILQSRRYGFIFGTNLFLAVLFKVLFSTVLDNRHVLNASVAVQVTVGGAIYGFFGICFLCKIVHSLIQIQRQNGGCCASYSNPQDSDLLVTSTS